LRIADCGLENADLQSNPKSKIRNPKSKISPIPMTNLLIATGNKGKAAEFRQMLETTDLHLVDLSQLPPAPEVEETGRTFRANACLKAAAYARHYSMWTLADDSGLEVDALGGDPGVYSARWAAMNDAGKGDADNNALLLTQLRDVPDEQRTARFVCVLALSDSLGRIILTTRDTVEGRILHAPRGQNGFGYDPLFFIPEKNKTTAELTPDDKHAISHRGKALRAMKALMDRIAWRPTAAS
jgi:non-canonical purine NTP pyrophosphatase (RdgB/HAM1 family)